MVFKVALNCTTDQIRGPAREEGREEDKGGGMKAKESKSDLVKTTITRICDGTEKDVPIVLNHPYPASTSSIFTPVSQSSSSPSMRFHKAKLTQVMGSGFLCGSVREIHAPSKPLPSLPSCGRPGAECHLQGSPFFLPLHSARLAWMGLITEPAVGGAALMAIALVVVAAQKRAARMVSFMVGWIVGRLWVKSC